MQQYTIAGITIEVSGKGLDGIPGFTVFSSEQENKKAAIIIDAGKALTGINIKPLYSFLFDDIQCEFAFADGKYYYKMIQPDSCDLIMKMQLRDDTLYITTNMDDNTPSYWYRFAVWMAFGVFSVTKGIVAIHASTILYNNKAILFLGESGTGKSTHTQLWLKHIPDTELLNDDSPFVFADNNCAIAFGSPWSGKTACYKNIHAPIAGIVRISQAPHNKIRKLSNLSAIGAIQPSCPPAFVCDEYLSDNIYGILSLLLQHVPVYSLECLPDEDAVQLVFSTLKTDGHI